VSAPKPAKVQLASYLQECKCPQKPWRAAMAPGPGLDFDAPDTKMSVHICYNKSALYPAGSPCRNPLQSQRAHHQHTHPPCTHVHLTRAGDVPSMATVHMHKGPSPRHHPPLPDDEEASLLFNRAASMHVGDVRGCIVLQHAHCSHGLQPVYATMYVS